MSPRSWGREGGGGEAEGGGEAKREEEEGGALGPMADAHGQEDTA